MAATNEPPETKPYGRFSAKKYILPFGRYVGSTDIEPPANEVLVGREGQRAHLIDLLISTGRRGAYLVTGRRGAGKTSFVKHCISEYEKSVLSRFLRGNVGRGVWDRTLVLLFWFAVLLGLLLLTELIQFLAHPTNEGESAHLRWLILAPVGIALLYPCVYARAIVEECIHTFLKQGKLTDPKSTDSNEDYGRWAGAAAVVFVIFLAILVWLYPHLGNPAQGVFLLLPVVASLYATAQALSFNFIKSTQSPPVPMGDQGGSPQGSINGRLKSIWEWPASKLKSAWESISKLPKEWSTRAALFLVPLAVFLYSSLTTLRSNLSLSLVFVGLGAIFRGADIGRQAGASQNRMPDSIKKAVTSGERWYLVFGVLTVMAGFTLLGLRCYLGRVSPWAIVLPISSFVILSGTFLLVQGKVVASGQGEPLFRPRPLFILLAKACVSIVVSLQLAYPALSFLACRLADRAISFFFEGVKSSKIVIPNTNAFCGADSLCHAATPIQSVLFIFRTQEVLWLGSLLIMITLLHFVEYEWIIRPCIRSREGQAFGAGVAAPWEDLESDPVLTKNPKAVENLTQINRDLAELTLPWETYRSWLPVLPVAVNLGFDRLNHRQVIQTMLVGLRERYHRTFLAWNSGFANLGRFLGLLVLLILTALIGRLLPAPKKPKPNNMPHNVWKVEVYGQLFSPTGHEPIGKEVGFPEKLWLTALKGYAVLSVPEAPDRNLLLGELLGAWPKEANNGAASEDEARNSVTTVTSTKSGLTTTVSRTNQDVTMISSTRNSRLTSRMTSVSGTLKPPPDLPLVYLCAYHLVILSLLSFLGHLLFHRMPLLPYKQNLRRIDDLLDSLSSRTKITSSLKLWGPARWIYSIFSDERLRETERDPVDPRTVELAFLQILEDVQKGGFRFPGAARHHLTMPAPEITFIFDELDKLGTRVDPVEETRDPAAPRQEIQIIQNERERSHKLRALLSDLKNILASAPARFIFVGGRDLHDEWLADQTSRLPLLTSIFNTEVYLPSLLTDQHDHRPRAQRRLCETDPQGGRPSAHGRLHERILDYLSRQYKRAQLLDERSARKRWLPSFGLSAEVLAPERFVSMVHRPLPSTPRKTGGPDGADVPHGEGVGSDHPEVLRCSDEPSVDSRQGRIPGQELIANDECDFGFVLDEFILFLTHRSMGNPKKLKDLLSSFIRPAERELDRRIRWKIAPCRHVIRFGDKEIFRIQLLVTIYRHLANAFEERMVKRDDKYATSIFFLTDFLFKFHRRAFSWSNLERVDDLAHIHRLPDLREIQEEIVDHFSERFLHRVTNGMYSFRFRSDVAREVEHLSRLSATEMAALNFTLDESLSLKSEYLAAIEGHEQDNPDLVGALGELYEFDQDFERARHQYRIAIDLLDRDLARMKGPERKVYKAVYKILDGRGEDYARIFLSWGVARLRLMLQIGMTFELERDLEQAEAEYRSARNLARALVKAYVGSEGQKDDKEGVASSLKAAEKGKGRVAQRKGLFQEFVDAFAKALEGSVEGREGEEDAYPPREASRSKSRLHSLKHINILFQPMFAEAWLAEKFVGSIDTSVTLIERRLWEIRLTLHFMRVRAAPLPEGQTQPRLHTAGSSANLSLTLSQLHNKAGDLYFFKGRQAVTPEKIRDLIENSRRPPEKRKKGDRSTDGYLVRAHYHYAVSLHDLRRYVHHRVAVRSKDLLSIATDASRTLLFGALPDFLVRAAAGSVNDMAEATLARISLFELFYHIREGRTANLEIDKPLEELLREPPRNDLQKCGWLGIDDEATGRSHLSNWFGIWKEEVVKNEPLRNLVDFVGPDPAVNRLARSLELSVGGASLFEAGGYPEDAGREFLQVCETVTRYLWWGLTVQWIGSLPEWVANDLQLDEQSRLRWQDLTRKVESWKKVEGLDLPMSDLFQAGNQDSRQAGFWGVLVDLGVGVLGRVDSLFRQSRHSVNADEESTYLVGETIPTEALTLLCSLGLAADLVADSLSPGGPAPPDGPGAGSLLKREKRLQLEELVRRWTGEGNEKPMGSEKPKCGTFEAILKKAIQRHSYPMINRLNGMKVMIDYLVLRQKPADSSEKDFQQAIEWAVELLDLNEQFDAPLHFTPIYSGVTCALVWLWGAHGLGEVRQDRWERIYRAAQRDLLNSEEMYTMRRSYYEAIGKLYYLYDDFNDRRIHFNHAIQMAGAELNALLKILVDKRDDLKHLVATKLRVGAGPLGQAGKDQLTPPAGPR